MKILCLALICLLFTLSSCGAETVAKYRAKTNVNFSLRDEVEGRKTRYVPKGSRVEILEWGDDWCQVEYQNSIGFCKTDWLYYIRSLDATKYALPNIKIPITGYVTFKQDTFVAGGEFEGLTAQIGQIACVSSSDDGTITLPVWRDKTTISSNAVTYTPFVNWRNAQSGDIIGGFTTFYGAQQGKGREQERAHNIRLGSERINGHVLQSWDTFSFNALCAPYKKKNGYQMAPNVSNDGIGYGGGVCQVTTTLYNAVLTLPLQIKEWSIHRYKGVNYVPQFFDAAVGSYSNFAFINTLPYAIRITVFPQNGMLTVLIYCA